MPDISKRLEKAEKYLQKNRLNAAIEEYLAAWKEDPANDTVAEIVGDLYVRQNQTERALKCYGYLFDKHTERNDGSKAILVFRKMAKLGEKDPARMLTLARFQEKQRPEEAQESYRGAAQTFLERGAQDQALEALRGLAALDDRNPDVHLQLGEVAKSLGRKEVAAGSLVRAAELRRASQAGEDGDNQVLALLEQAHALAPSDGHVATALAKALFESGSPRRVAQLLEPLASQGLPEVNLLLAQAHLATGNLNRAEELLWGIASGFPDAYQHLQRVTEGYLRRRNTEEATNLLRKLKKSMFAASKDRDFIAFLDGLQQKRLAGIEVLEFLAELYNELNYDSQLSSTSAQLFDLYVDAEEYAKAASALDRIVDVNPYDAQNSERLQRLSGKVDAQRHEAIALRFQQTADTAAPMAAAEAKAEQGGQSGGGEAESDVLEDLILQAEIFAQYGLKHRAVERLERIARLFPGEEQRNEKLRSLYASAQFSPKPAARAEAPAAPAAESAAEETMAEITRVAEITRNIYREGTVKSVMSTAANEIGKTWRASRCVVGLCTPGKPPSAVVEYCASGVPQSEVLSIVKLVATLVQLTPDGNPLSVEDAAASAKLSKLAPVVQSLQIKSLLALPLMETDQPIGVIVFEQCDRMRSWRSNDVVVLRALVDQTTIAISHVKLRSLMKTLAVADEHSGMLNRGSYLNCVLSECSRAQKQHTPLSVLLLQFGSESQAVRELEEAVVQQYVQEAAQVVMGHLRQNDIAIRYDPTTLALVLPDTKGKDTFFVVDKMRKMIGGVKMAGGDGLPMTAGIAEAFLEGDIDPVDSVTELINRLEQALEAALREGGGTSKLLKPPLESSTTAA